jgi:hypothetical protein
MERRRINPQPNFWPSAFGFWRWIRTRDAFSALIRLFPKGTGPNWTYGRLDPMPTRAGLAIAQTLIAAV